MTARDHSTLGFQSITQFFDLSKVMPERAGKTSNRSCTSSSGSSRPLDMTTAPSPARSVTNLGLWGHGRYDRQVFGRIPDGAAKSAVVEADRLAEAVEYRVTSAWDALGLGDKAACGVVGMSVWMLLMTAIFFHTWIEKVVSQDHLHVELQHTYSRKLPAQQLTV